MKLLTKIFGYFLVLLSACIPLSDAFPPSVDVSFPEGDIAVESIYYQDSIILQVFYEDNVALDFWRLRINRLEVANLNADWVYQRVDNVPGNARGLEERVAVPIPSRTNNEYVSTGDYELDLTIFDLESNSTTFTDTFNIGGDITPPVFQGLSSNLSTELPAGAPNSADYVACPNLPVEFFGKVSDNTKLRRIGYSYGNLGDDSYPIRTSVFEYDTVEVSPYLNDSLSIQFPSELNRSVVALNVFAEDVFDNRYDTTFQVYLDCDASPPLFSYSSLSREPVNGIVEVIEGTDFFINDLSISDNEALRDLQVFLYPLSGSPTIWQEYLFDGRVADTLFQPFIVPQSELIVGEDYQLNLLAHDTTTVFLPTGNEGSLSFQLQVRPDLPPSISSMDFIVNEETPSTEVFLGRLPGDTITLPGVLTEEPLSILVPDGKASDELGITTLKMIWHQPNGLSQEVVNRNFSDPPEVIKFLDFFDRTTAFPMEETGLYQLEIIMEDTKGQESGATDPASDRSYFFLIE